MSDLLTPAEAAKLMRVCVRTVWRRINSGQIKAVNVGSIQRPLYRIRHEDLETQR